jgi:hypothetical protein
MQERSYRDTKHQHDGRAQMGKNDRKGAGRDRHLQSIHEGWDVGGPRWRIGWGGLPVEPKERKAPHSERGR